MDWARYKQDQIRAGRLSAALDINSCDRSSAAVGANGCKGPVRPEIVSNLPDFAKPAFCASLSFEQCAAFGKAGRSAQFNPN